MDILESDIQLSTSFSKDVTKTTVNHYKKRNQSNVKKIEEQSTYGKVAEFCIQRFLGLDVLPDLNVYESKKKSFDFDLAKIVHVKSQSIESANKYGLSFMFQYAGAGYGHTDPVIVNPSGFLCLVKVDLTNKKSWLVCCLESCKCLPDLLEEPVVWQLKNTKRVLYYSTLEKKFGKDNLCSDIPALKLKLLQQ